jgi:superfamily II DNA helicase RecQ
MDKFVIKTPRVNSVNDCLKKTFRLQEFRGSQKEIIDATMQGKDVVALLPTGELH